MLVDNGGLKNTIYESYKNTFCFQIKTFSHTLYLSFHASIHKRGVFIVMVAAAAEDSRSKWNEYYYANDKA